ncbi:RNA polymerase sigma-70 factor [Sphingobacterium daejeonense]|uniref:RNA polymerase sigma-70 factor n=1 Tax=Sphingobacterium daejeonense TaxID=371142 RepID=UPI003D314507
MDYTKATDFDLWIGCQKQGDLKAYEELFDRYIIPLIIHAEQCVKNTYDAEEIVMDLMFNIWEKRTTLNIDGENIKNYIYRALRNRITNHLKKKLHVTLSLDNVEDDTFIYNLHPDHRIIENQINEEFQKRVAMLSPKRQQVFLLCREENLSYKQVALRLGLSASTVENHMTSALNFLRKYTNDLTTLSLLIAYLY